MLEVMEYTSIQGEMTWGALVNTRAYDFVKIQA
jgi:hypothetical protein